MTGRFALAAFLLTQVADGTLTYLGVQHYGHGEANPLLASLIAVHGPAVVLVGAKLMAGLCGTFLYLVKSYRVLVAMALFYLIAAVIPWLYLLLRGV